METIIYFGKVSLYWILLYGCYWLLLRKHTFFQWNRAYLVGSLLVAFLLPEVIYPASAPELPLYQAGVSAVIVTRTAAEQPFEINWWRLLAAVYGMGVVFFGTRLVRELLQLVKYLRSGEVIELEDCSIVLIDSNQVGSFSFLKWIVINRNDYENHFDAILRHEMVHTHQRHSLDILLVEVLAVAFWFHPLLPFYKRSLQEIHEYLADAAAPNREHYARFLVAYALNAPVQALTNHFFKPSQIKNRIHMIYKNRTSKWMLGTYVVAATLIGTSALFVAGCESQVSKEESPAEKEARTTNDNTVFTVVEVQPEFPGGTQEMYKFLGRKIKYPTKAYKADIQGKVFVNFIVTSTGDIKDVTILKGIGGGCDEEAVRVVSSFPKWTPAKQNGIPVNVKFTLPISFQLAEEGEDTSTDKGSTVVGFKAKPVSEAVETQPVQADRPVEGSHITFRGNPDLLSGSTQPLYMLNGEEVKDPELVKNMDGADIQSISVFKNAEATKIYGARGVNGVVSIITKSK